MVKANYFARTRVERVIGLARVALAMSGLFAVWLDPFEPERYEELTYALHSVYLAYAIVLAGVMWNRDSKGALPSVLHFGDIAVASVFQYLTLGPSSPFFTYFVFSLFSAALRWGWRETVRTAVFVFVAFIVISLSLSRTLGPREFEMSRFVIRLQYLVVVAVVLAYLGLHEERLREEIRGLARWPLAAASDTTTVVGEILEHSAAVLGAGRVTMAWTTEEEDWLHLATWPATAGSAERHPPEDLAPLVPEALREAAFVCPGPLTADALVDVSRAGNVGTWRGLPVHPGLVSRLDSPGLASAAFRTEQVSGRVFFSNLRILGADMLPLVEVVGREIGSSFDQLYFYERSRKLAIAEERVRLARDLHDGVLQSLTGIRFELQSLSRKERRAEQVPAEASPLLSLERAIALEQRELRRFIDDLKPTTDHESGYSLADRLEELRRRLVLEWRAPITIRVRPEDLAVPGDLDRGLTLMVQEAVANALKHGAPSRVSVDIESVNDTLRVVVTDDGRGFAFQGRRDHAALVAANEGPVSLRERVAALGGQITIDSGLAGSRVELSIPFQAAHV